MTAAPRPQDRSLPLRERKKLRTRRALADAALRLFGEQGFDATTLEELVDAVEVSKSTFFRTFPAKEAVAIEAEVELWSACLAALAERPLTGLVLAELQGVLAEVTAALDPDWDERYAATRELVRSTPALLSYMAHYRNEVEQQIIARLAERLDLPADDLRLRVLAQLTITAWSVSARDWVHSTDRGDRSSLTARLARTFAAIPAGLELRAGG
ncbi:MULTISPECIES: TetR family transcriptional regulator [unclassified Kitasatospora]|uniref:TetR family transcriptional regulator n=1 Tax=unclassified Kitasatospora TaxID=2633591 RepID=UPI00070B363F|nr:MULTISPECIES: TetR family transcriptional regulator [unclassified Kitasatospora]KQV18721.1 hypothetical protein ASC99_05845 [Kitasatospora sp. Root107]KRB74702.1 hypothetical protein ASE03_19780 [Kitasatospora sp. Root187]